MIRAVQKDLFAVIGNPVAHSLSPTMMHAAFDHLGFPGVYLALEADSIREDLDTLWKMGFHGLSVTIPHKESAFLQATPKDGTAEAIGAVNTLRRHETGWQGKNTDWIGSNRALEQATRIEGKQALVLGAGGAARAVVYGLLHAGAKVIISNRGVERGEALARAFECEFVPLAELEGSPVAKSVVIVVQCTPVGLMRKKDSPLVSDSFFRPGMVVLDTVYRPLWTDFLLKARSAGCLTVHGLEMLLHQGVAQLEWWLGYDRLEVETTQVMRDALWKALSRD